MNDREIILRLAVIEAIEQEMARDPEIFYLGEDVGEDLAVARVRPRRDRGLDRGADRAGVGPVAELRPDARDERIGMLGADLREERRVVRHEVRGQHAVLEVVRADRGHARRLGAGRRNDRRQPGAVGRARAIVCSDRAESNKRLYFSCKCNSIGISRCTRTSFRRSKGGIWNYSGSGC